MNISETIQTIREKKIARRVWPPDQNKEFTLPETLELHAKQIGDELGRALALVDALLEVPILAVAGLNDQGKSSLVASFLSPMGASRVLCGTRGVTGTFRFTLWMPAKWQENSQLRVSIDKAITSIFGHAPESLPIEPAMAFEVQNAHGALDTPLIAWDERLDELGIALLDCPDIQKRPTGGNSDSARLRLEMLRKASKVCAGIILVAKHQNLTTNSFSAIAESFSDGLRVYALNQIRDLNPHDVLSEARAALSLPDDALCYAAYDYDLNFYEEYTPAWDPNREITGSDGKFPCFFSLSAEPVENEVDRIDENRSLHSLALKLDKENLVRDFQRGSLSDLRAKALEGISVLEGRLSGQADRIQKICNEVWDACSSSFKANDNEVFTLSAEMMNGLSNSIVDCAPFGIRHLLKAKAMVGKALSIAFKAMDPFQIFGRSLSHASGWIKKNTKSWQGRKVESNKTTFPERLSISLLNRWRSAGLSISEHETREVVGGIMNRYNEVGISNLTEVEWNEIAREFWKDAPKGKAAIMVATAVLAALGVGILTAFEPLSGTVLSTFLIGKLTVAITVPELLAALGFGAVVNMTCVADLQNKLESKLGPLQRSRFFAVACDELGLPREYPDGIERDPTLPLAVNPDGFCLREFDLFSEETISDTLSLLHNHLETLK